LGQRDTETLDALPLERARHRRGAVAVSVGLHHREDRAGPDAAADRAQVRGQGRQIDLGPGGAVRIEERHHPACCSSSSKRVYWRRKAMLNSPVGPLRCLAMMMVAMPRFSSVGL